MLIHCFSLNIIFFRRPQLKVFLLFFFEECYITNVGRSFAFGPLLMETDSKQKLDYFHLFIRVVVSLCYSSSVNVMVDWSLVLLLLFSVLYNQTRHKFLKETFSSLQETLFINFKLIQYYT